MTEKLSSSFLFCLLILFSTLFAISVTVTYFTDKAEKVITKIKYEDYDPEHIVFFWFFLSCFGSLLLGLLILVTAYYLIEDISGEIYEEAVLRVKAELQDEHTALSIETQL